MKLPSFRKARSEVNLPGPHRQPVSSSGDASANRHLVQCFMDCPPLAILSEGQVLGKRSASRSREKASRRCEPFEVAKVGRFCCPALPEPLESPSVARWGPTAL